MTIIDNTNHEQEFPFEIISAHRLPVIVETDWVEVMTAKNPFLLDPQRVIIEPRSNSIEGFRNADLLSGDFFWGKSRHRVCV